VGLKPSLTPRTFRFWYDGLVPSSFFFVAFQSSPVAGFFCDRSSLCEVSTLIDVDPSFSLFRTTPGVVRGEIQGLGLNVPRSTVLLLPSALLMGIFLGEPICERSDLP